MANVEIRKGDAGGEVIASHEGVDITTRGFRDHTARIVEGYEVRDAADDVIEFMAVDHTHGVMFTDTGLILNGVALYYNGDLSRCGTFFYDRQEGYDYTPPGPAVERETHAWVVSFPQQPPATT